MRATPSGVGPGIPVRRYYNVWQGLESLTWIQGGLILRDSCGFGWLTLLTSYHIFLFTALGERGLRSRKKDYAKRCCDWRPVVHPGLGSILCCFRAEQLGPWDRLAQQQVFPWLLQSCRVLIPPHQYLPEAWLSLPPDWSSSRAGPTSYIFLWSLAPSTLGKGHQKMLDH